MTPVYALLAGIAPFIIIVLGYYSGLWLMQGEPIAVVGFGIVLFITIFTLFELHYLDLTNATLHGAVKVVMLFSGSAGGYVLYKDAQNRTLR